MPSQQFTVKTNSEAVQTFETAYNAARAENPALTKGAFFEQFITQKSTSIYDSGSDADRAVILEENIRNKQFVQEIADLLEVQNDYEQIISEIRATQQRAMNVPAQIEVPEPMQENEIRFTIPEPHLTLLRTEAERLSTEDNKVTIKDILLDMFIRYEVLRLNEWFYTWKVRDAEFKQLTGYTRKEIASCL